MILKFIIIWTFFISMNAFGSGFRESSTNTPGSVTPSTIGMQWRSYLERNVENTRQWAEYVIANPLETYDGDTRTDINVEVKFEVLVLPDWVVADQTNYTKIHTFHSGSGGPNYYRIYIRGDQFYFLSASQSYTAPISFGVVHNFIVRTNIDLITRMGNVEIFLDQEPSKKPNTPPPFVPKHDFQLKSGDIVPYIQIGLDTHGDGMPDGVQSRELNWSLLYVTH